jgi:hypothetical protein
MKDICNPYHSAGQWLPQSQILLDEEASILKYSVDEEAEVCNQDCETVAYACSKTFGKEKQAHELAQALLSGLKRAKFTEYACTEGSGGVCKKEGYYPEVPADHPKRDE